MQLKSLGFSYDWQREISTTEPDYYKWTQWIFLQLFKRGLAYEVNSSRCSWQFLTRSVILEPRSSFLTSAHCETFDPGLFGPGRGGSELVSSTWNSPVQRGSDRWPQRARESPSHPQGSYAKSYRNRIQWSFPIPVSIMFTELCSSVVLRLRIY